MRLGQKLCDCLEGWIRDWKFLLWVGGRELSQQCSAALAAAPAQDEYSHADHHVQAEDAVVVDAAAAASAANHVCGLYEP